MIETHVLYRYRRENGRDLLVMGAKFKGKLIYVSVAVGRPNSKKFPPVDVQEARHALQIYSGCVKSSEYHEVVIHTLIAVPIAVYSALLEAENEHAVLFLADTPAVLEGVLQALKVESEELG